MAVQVIREIQATYNQDGKKGLEERLKEEEDCYQKSGSEEEQVAENEAEIQGRTLVLRRTLHTQP